MEIHDEAKLLRIFVSSTDKLKHTPLYEAIVFAAKRNGIAGATVIKGVMGYGSSSIISTQKFWEFTEKVPVIIEIIDTAEKIDSFVQKILPYFERIPKDGLITVEKATIVLHKSGKI
jgi:PII-like signaling protein